MARTIISTDSPADVPAEIRERYDIRVIPLHIILDDDCFEDGVNIQPDDLYAFYKKTGRLPKTSAVSVAEYTDFFKELTQDGSSVVHISFSSALSATHQNARLAAEDFDNVYIVDSKSLSTGIALLAIKAAQLAQDGLDAKTIAHEMEYKREKVVTTFILDKLEFLYKGGRCSTLSYYGSKVLSIHPQIAMKDGKLYPRAKYMGNMMRCLKKYVSDLAAAYTAYDATRCFVTHSHADAELVERAKELARETFRFNEIIETVAGSIVTSHCGRNTIGILFIGE